MSPIKLRVLIDAKRFVETMRANRSSDEMIILSMIGDFNAKRDFKGGSYVLSCCGVTGYCTASRDKGLLNSWLRATIRRIAKETGQ
ncbi:hypothetical protein [Novosphingobium naphthalenivorans]|uniref:hypothetical protein n=1 Tax=Novosphingobium naphthalenivorans TaxID=273168 RepID=UPI00082BE61D|nr:hypothetical protein [Novosphingobium naphthalenivorans]